MTEPAAPLKMPMDANAIRALLPHRYPFLLVDRVLELDPGKSITAIKMVSQNEPFFTGHFPQAPILPGVLQIEALAQTGAMAMLAMPTLKNRLIMLAGVEDFRFRRPVVPGDVLRMEVIIERCRSNFGKGRAKATVDGEVTAEGGILFAMTTPDQLDITKPADMKPLP